jgi:hypothetical protein
MTQKLKEEKDMASVLKMIFMDPTLVEKIGGIYHIKIELNGIILLNKKCQNTLSQKVNIIRLIKETKK